MNFVKNAPNFACSFVRSVKQCSMCFLAEVYFVFEKLCENIKNFPRASPGDLLLNEKQKKPFVSLRMKSLYDTKIKISVLKKLLM